MNDPEKNYFNFKCLEPWLTSSKTCPTCRCATTNTSLIKLFFTFDDQKANFHLEDVLKTNDELTQNFKQFQEKSTKLEVELREVKEKFKELSASEAMLKRQKQLDDMTIAGISGIKNESTKEIIKLNQALTALKLDLLAEKQLRRIHQKSLHELKPNDMNYDVKSIDIPDSSTAGKAPKDSSKILEFHKIAVPQQLQINESKPYVIPSKIQKSNEDAKARQFNFNMKASILKNSKGEKPAGFQFHIPTFSSSPSPCSQTSAHQFQFHSQPSSSASSSTVSNNKRSFGEGIVFHNHIPQQVPTQPETSLRSIYNYSFSSLPVQLSPQTPSTSSNMPTISSPLRNYRESSESLPSTSSDLNSNGGPKTSDR